MQPCVLDSNRTGVGERLRVGMPQGVLAHSPCLHLERVHAPTGKNLKRYARSDR